MSHRMLPIHIDQITLLYIVQSGSVTITPKADGTYDRYSQNGQTYEAERMSDGDMIIFNGINKGKGKPISPIESMEHIRRYFLNDERYEIEFTDLSALDKEMKREKVRYLLNDEKWYPKPIYRLVGIPPHMLLKWLDNPPNTGYSNDGWILYTNKPYKLKPADEMTVDLMYLGDSMWVSREGTEYLVSNPDEFAVTTYSIHRLVWSKESGTWKPRDIRDDKREPNPDSVVKSLEHFHHQPWKPSDLIPAIETSIYYSHESPKKLDEQTVFYLNKQRNITNVDIWSLKPERLLDIGCGAGKLLLDNGIKKQLHRYHGIDLDPISIYKARLKFPSFDFSLGNLNADGFVSKITSLDNPITKRSLGYDTVVMNFSITYVDSLSKFVDELDNWVSSPAKIYISTLYAEPDQELPSYITRETSDSRMRIVYPWLGDHVRFEKWFSPRSIIEAFEKKGWKNHPVVNPGYYPSNPNLAKHNALIKRIILTRNE